MRPARLLAALLLLPLAPPATGLEIATPCRARDLRLAGGGGGAEGSATLLLWQEGEGGKGGGQGCRGETRGAWIEGDAFTPLPEDFLGPGFRHPASGARATALEGGRLLVVWAEGGAIVGALLAPGAKEAGKRFPVSPPDTPSDVAAPRPLAAAGGGFLVVYESDFFSGRKRNPVFRAFDAEGEPQGEIQPAAADFVNLHDPLAARLGSGGFAVAGPGLGPLGESFFVQFLGTDGELLGEPEPADAQRTVLGGDLAATGESYVFTWNIRAGKGQKALARQHGADGAEVGKSRELGPTAGAPSLAKSRTSLWIAWVDPGPERQLRLLQVKGSLAEAQPQAGPKLPEGVDRVALGESLVAWAEPARIVTTPLPAGK